MARNSKLVIIHLEELIWRYAITAGGDPDSVTPYLWTLFYKVDGSNVSLNAGGTLSGQADVVTTPGSHGDLGTSSINVGDSITIPSVLGWWSDTIRPIPVDPSLQSRVGVDLPGFFGVVVVATAWHHVTDSAAEAGHAALNAYVASAIDKLVASIGPLHQSITQADIDSVTSGAPGAVESAIKNAQSTWQNIVSWTEGPDQLIGYLTLPYNQDLFTHTTDRIVFSEALDSVGMWAIAGRIDVTNACAAETSLSVIEQQSPEIASTVSMAEGISAMRAFRDSGGLRQIPAAAWWWDRASRHSAELTKLLLGHPELRAPVARLLQGIAGPLQTPDKPVPESLWQDLALVLGGIAKHGSRSMAVDARHAAALVTQLSGKSLVESDRILGQDRLKGSPGTVVVL